MSTVAVVGAAGGVGSVAAARVAEDPLVDGLLLVDPRHDLLAVQAMDLHMAVADRSPVTVLPADPERLGAADVVLCAAGVPHRDGEPRSAFAAENWRICSDLVACLPRSWTGLLVLATNPVDVLTTLVRRAAPPGATVAGLVDNDGVRLRRAVAEELGASPAAVDLPVLGEHGGVCVPLWDRLRVDGRPVRLDRHRREALVAGAPRWYDSWQRHRTGRTSMWTTGRGLARLAARWIADEATAGVVCAPARGILGVDRDVCLGVPVVLGARQLAVRDLPLRPDQRSGLRRAAESVSAQVGAVSAQAGDTDRC